MPEVVIIGGGLIGCACALKLAQRGCGVLVLERGGFGSLAASSRAAGILGAQIELHATQAMSALCLASRERYRTWAPEVHELSGVDPGYRVSGVLRVVYDASARAALQRELDENLERDLDAELLEGDELRELEPQMSDAVVAGLHFPRDGIVDPPALLEATRRAAERAGATLRERAPVAAIEHHAGRVRAVRLDDGSRVEAEAVVIAAGSWSSLLEGLAAPTPSSLWPTRGQMLELRVERPPLSRVLDTPEAYLSPRRDGRVLVGSTVERVGFDDAVIAAVAAALLAGAIKAVPSLASARLSGSWSGFRAETPDQLPIFGSPGLDGLSLATGHYRNGVLLAPISADIISALVFGERPPVDLAPFAPERFAP